MREHPILFSGPMVRAILEGRKTQTRRVVKPQPVFGDGGCWYPYVPRHNADARPRHYASESHFRKGAADDFCPYGRPGDLLWVRETWAPRCADARMYGTQEIIYKADGGLLGKPGWRPSIHMPRWASRLTLRVTDVRVQRLQDITGRDARAEGVEPKRFESSAVPGHMGYSCDQVVADFAALWDTINGKRAPWDSNPWVWAVSFEVTK